MKISIIIPCYNAATYLPACLDSVLAQDMPDFEVIAVDDGSLDRTAEILREYAQKDARIKPHFKENSGVSATRNMALDRAAGEWVTFVDADDVIDRDMLSCMLAAADDGIDMVVCAHRTFDEAGDTQLVWPQTRWPQKRGEARKRAAALRLIEGDSVMNIMCAKLHRRALIEREHIRLCEEVSIAEDALFNLEALLRGEGIAYVHRAAYGYRMHAQSAMHAKTAGSTFDVHRPWLAQMRALLVRLGAIEGYYAAYVDSVALRLYKDGGVGGVIRDFNEKAGPLVDIDGLDKKKMTPYGRLVHALCGAGRYPLAYPLIYPVQVGKRKLGELAFALRARRERPQ